MQINYNNKMKELSSLPSRKPITCKFTSAQPRKLFTNYYSIVINQSKSMLYQYSYLITPDIQSDSSLKLQSIIRNIWKQLVEKIGLISIRGNNLYGSKNLEQQKTFISQYHENDAITKYEVLIKKIKNLPIIQMLHSNRENQVKIAIQVLNVDTKERLKKMNMIELDQGRYYSINKDISQNLSNGFFILKGYSFTAEKLKIGLSLHVQIFSRLIRQRNVLQQISAYKSKDQIRQALVDSIVLTRYGNFRTYKIIQVCFDKTPMTRFVPVNQQKEITFFQYFKHNYDVDITIKNQPLLKIVTKIEKVKRKGGISEKVIHQGYLIPQLVSIVGFSKQHIKNPLLMKQISSKTQVSVDNRVKQYDTKIQELNKVQGLYKIQNVKIVDGFQLEQPIIQLKRSFRAQNGQIKIDKQIIKQPAEFKNWLFVTHQNHQKEANELDKALKIAAESYGITLQKSGFFIMQETKVQYWKEDLIDQFEYYKQNKKQMPQIVMVLIGGSLKDQIYQEIKNLCSTKYQICSQFTIVNKIISLNQKNHLLSYASSLILQMNSKIGKPIWEVPIQNKTLSKKIIGIAAIAMSKIGGKCSLGFVGTINSKLSKVYNQTITKKKFSQFDTKSLSPIFTNWLRCFFQFNLRKIMPEIIVFYREGLNSTEATKNIQIQIDALKQAINQAKIKTKMTQFNPQIVYLSVNKRSSTRFYEKFVGNAQKFGPKYMNPLSGSVIVDNLAPDNILNFHLSSCTPNPQTTSSPTEVIFHYHQPKRTPPQAFIELTFEQSFNYYNWRGAIKPPACLQNADRLAKLAGKTLKENITFDNALSKTYHFL